MQDKKASDKKYYEANKEKLKAKMKAYYEANKEKIKADSRTWQEANKENRKAYLKAYNEANRERMNAEKKAWAKANKEKRKAIQKTWRESNKEKVNVWTANRRAAKLNRTPSWLTEEDLGKIKEFYKEAQKRKEETGEEWHVDHIIPLQGENISGLHVPDNLQILRATENKRKHNRYTI